MDEYERYKRHVEEIPKITVAQFKLGMIILLCTFLLVGVAAITSLLK